MKKIMMTGAYTEQADTQKFFADFGDGAAPIDREAAGVFAYVWAVDGRLNHYMDGDTEVWELLD